MRRSCVTTFLFWLSSFTLAASSGGNAELVYSGTSLRQPVGRSFHLLEDPKGNMTLGDVRASDGAVRCTNDIPNLGTSTSAYWIQFSLLNTSSERNIVMQMLEPDVDEFDVYLHMGGRDTLIARAGKARIVPAGQRSSSDLSFVLPIPTGERATVFIRVRSFKQLQVPIVLLNPADAMSDLGIKRVFVGAFIGIMLVMALYNLFVFFSIRDRSYLAYVVYLVFVAFTQLSFLGMLPLNHWTGGLWFSARSSVILTVVTAIVASEFMKRFIHVNDQLPKLARVTPVFYAVLAAIPVLYLFGMPVTAYNLAQAVVGSFAGFLLLEAGIIAYRGSRPAAFFLIAWCLFLTGVIVFILKDLHVLPYNSISKHLMPLGSALEVVLLSFGLADKINILRREKELSQADALRVSQENERIIRDQNVVLEQKVTERTQELRQSNEHLKRTQSQLVNSEKMASLGQLTAGIAHEINNPVNFISSNIPPLRRNISEMMDVLRQYREAGSSVDAEPFKRVQQVEAELGIDDSIAETTDMLNSIENGASRTAEIVRGLRNFSRLDEGDLKHASLNEGLKSTIALLSPQVRDLVRIDLDLCDMPPIECYPGKLNQVFMNVLTNAAQAVRSRFPSGGGIVTVKTESTADRVEVIISDNGPGFSPELKERMFEPFFTTKGVGEGTGLGLSIAYGIIEKHKGTIVAESEPGMGASFRIVLPILQQQNVQRA